MEVEFDPIVLGKKIEKLSAWKKLAFALSICERLYPNFVRFSNEVGFSGHETLRSCLNSAWEILENEQSNTDYSLKAQACESIAPDTEDYQTILVSSALDAAISISYLMSCFADLDSKLIVEIASLSRDSVDMYVQELEDLDPQDSNLEKKILEHPLMQSELDRQNKDIEFLYSVDDELNASLLEVKGNWFNTQKSNLELTV